ncbi:fimbrillin family protein [Parasphaerochaeta coccoides]|uniref:Regulator of chromosome condensation RCC1 n=1 Tax=Parasphaerochaeta coccoides (strain ATCC BAA-1237 / DSM 17374 / SPN1) TaxID=760011 RepID=F4GJY1_PARC1|nr:fimbrillin family protein [Parasphaerochaeta coccoides]AEC01406.1 regulator of chromosome condensation RCC1 [Parasphaerochaeta coccoides DSM 17374]
MNKFSKPVFIVLTTILMLLITFISCDSKLNVSHTNAVRFSTEIGRKVSANSEWEVGDVVSIYMLDHEDPVASAVTERANKHYKADVASQTSSFIPVDDANTLKWNDIDNNASDTFDFIAFFPYVPAMYPGADQVLLDVITGGNGEQETGMADALWGRTDNVQNNTSTVQLKLDHMLSRLIVNIIPSTTVDKDAIDDGTLDATIKGLHTTVSINLNDGSLSTPNNSDKTIYMRNVSDTLGQEDYDAGKRRFEAVLIPTGNTFALDNLILEFTLSGGAGAGTYTWKPSTTGAVADGDKHLIHFDKGKQHVYNMTLNTSDEEVAVAAIEIEIGEWDEGDGINGAATFKPYRAVSAGNTHTMILKNNGTLWATGYNGAGQLGVGDQNNRTMPVQVKASTDPNDFMTDVKEVSTGATHTMILKKDGTLWATGANQYGQLGDDTTANKSTPVQVMPDVAAVSAGLNYTMILKTDGTLWAIGFNSFGQLGVGDQNNRTTPVQVMPDVAAVSATVIYTMILKTDGTLWATGNNYSGQLGIGNNENKSTPMQVSSMGSDVAAVSGGDIFTMILKKDGTLWATGDNTYGQLGVDEATTYTTNIPVQVKGSGGVGVMTDVAAVSTGGSHAMILKKDGTLWATGNNTTGQLGLGNNENKNTPVLVMPDVAAVSTGASTTMILKKDGTLWATGLNDEGQLGDNTIVNTNTPVQVIF